MSTTEVTPSTTPVPQRQWLRPVLAGVGGALVMLVVSQISSRAGGSCMILCNPLIAVPYGAFMGVIAMGFPRQRGASSEASDASNT
jgi:hypothetical protein